jgi:hypothetical protein
MSDGKTTLIATAVYGLSLQCPQGAPSATGIEIHLKPVSVASQVGKFITTTFISSFRPSASAPTVVRLS